MKQDMKNKRPLSPHLQIYRLPMTAWTSISHRASGIILTLGLIVLSAWIIAAGLGEDAYNNMNALVDWPVTKYLLLLWAFVFFYHLANGVRHLIWDLGIGISRSAAPVTGALVILFAVLATIGLWIASNYRDAPAIEGDIAQNMASAPVSADTQGETP